jgi:Spy/CpxP family protein refolding chaperone
MKSYVKVFAPFMLAILVGSLTLVFAQTKDGGRGFDGKRPPRGEGFGPPPMNGGLPPHVFEKLNLTSTQKEQIETLHTNSRDAGKEYFEKVRTSDEQLRTMVEDGNFNEESARQIISAKTSAQTELELIRLRTDAAIFGILTAEQKAQLAQMKEERPPFPPGKDGFRPEKRR